MYNESCSWEHIREILYTWYKGDSPTGAVLMAVFMVVLRIAYMGGGWKRMLLEGLLCGALTLTFASALEYLNWPKSLSVAIGGGIGFIGVDTFRALALRFAGKRFGEDK